MADLALGAVIKKLIEASFAYSKDQVRWQTGMKEELEKLQKTLTEIQAVVSAYSQGQIESPGLSEWYWQLRDAVDEADDVLDEIEYRKLAKQASKNKKTGKVRFLMKSIRKRVVEISQRALKIDPKLKRLEAAVQNLNEISAKVSTFLSLVQGAERKLEEQQLQLHKSRETGSMLGNKFVGRSDEITFVKDWLSKQLQTQDADPDDLYSNISLLSVVGDGGMGKTTLLQRVYQDVALNKDGETEGFDLKIWVCVSINSDATKVIKNILESLKNKRSDSEDLNELQSSLQSELMAPIQSENKPKRFLLVLDDIWEEDETCWRNVLTPLRIGSLESKILITTRMKSVASMFAKIIKKGNENLPLEDLEEEELAKLFNEHAFAGVENPDDEFRYIAKMMVKKLLSCPLAAKVIGGILNSYVDKSFWTNVLNTNIRSVKQIKLVKQGKLVKQEKPRQNDLLSILNLSYIYLPNYLQNCFSFCCIFPQDYEFDRDDLVRMWIALGFIQSSDIPEETLEDIGRRYFNYLVRWSFFDEFRTYDDRAFYKMHNLLHELAQSISAQESFSAVVGDEGLPNLPLTARHLSIEFQSRYMSTSIKTTITVMRKFKNLRSLFLSISPKFFIHDFEIYKLLEASKNIRLLVISARDVKQMPESISSLIHLRYLKVKFRSGLNLSRSMSQILARLHHLQFTISEKFQISDINDIGLEACSSLQGGIRNCSSVYIRRSPNLIHLTNCRFITDELVMKDPSVLLRSISSLRYLTIEENDELVSLPTETEQWFQQHSSSLFKLTFYKLRSLQSLPSLSTFSSLRYLKLKNIPLLKTLPDLPSSLKELILEDLESLNRLPSFPPTLLEVLIKNVPRLLDLPVLPASLSLCTEGCDPYLMERSKEFLIFQWNARMAGSSGR